MWRLKDENVQRAKPLIFCFTLQVNFIGISTDILTKSEWERDLLTSYQIIKLDMYIA